VQAWHALYVLGVVAEFAGIVALGFPDLLPGARRLSAWLSRHGRRASNRLRRLVRREPRVVTVTGGLSAGVAIGGHASAVVSTSETTLEGQVAYLLQRDRDAQEQANAFAARLNQLEADSPRRLAEARQEMEQHVARELALARDEYLDLRVAGTGALVLGLVLVTVATFIA
jgi:hypothetical protein